jgi:hypothetical protein
MKPEPDPLRCSWTDCDREPTVATPDGPMCPRHSAKLARRMEEGR